VPLDPLITTSQLTSYTTGDPDMYVDIASGIIRSYCHWHIAPQITQQRVFDGSGSEWLSLRSLKVVNVSNLVVRDDPWDAADYTWSEDGWLQAKGRWNDFVQFGRHRFPRQARSVSLTLTHGYDEMPGAILAVALGVAARAQEMPSSWIRSIRAGLYQYDFGGRMSANEIGGFQITAVEMSQLDPYRLQVVN
jgi:hypothetical protein